MANDNAMSLYELNALVGDVIESTLYREYWVQAELSEAREVRGHCYMDLIQKDVFTNTPIARAQARCWQNRWSALRPQFEKATGQTLHAGLKVMLRVKASFHVAYGFAWIVTDIDPSFTMGDMARKRLEIIDQLKKEGVFELQKELRISRFAKRIAVISSEGAAGYGDFCRQLADNQYGLCFEPRLFPAIMQGEGVEASVIDALNAIYNNVEDYDVVVIIRGGGATSDLSGFDSLALAENVANFPLPIITGIGHDRDESVLDMISNTRVKTPTAAAAFLIDNLLDTLSRVVDAQDAIVMAVRRKMDVEQMRFSRMAAGIRAQFSVMKTRQMARLSEMLSRIGSRISARLMRDESRVELCSVRMRNGARMRLEKEAHRMEIAEQRIKAADPQLLLRRGYSITLHNGKAVRDADELRRGDIVKTIVEHGSFEAEVK